MHHPGAGGPAVGGLLAVPAGGDRGHGHRGGEQGHGLDPGGDGQGDARDQGRVPVDQEVDGQQEQSHGHADPVAVEAGGDEQHRADRDQDRRPGGQLERPPGTQHLEHQEGRAQVGHTGRDPGQQVERGAAPGGGGQGDGQQLHGQRGQRGDADEPLE
jgi:hypothetical protein